MKIVLFDIDGTLLLTGGVGKIAFEKAFEELFGIKDSWGEIIPDGKTDPLIINEIIEALKHKALTSVQYRKLCRRYHDYFQTEIKNARRFRIMPGVSKLIPFLAKQPGLLLGVATGNFEEAAWMKLQHAKLDSYFRFGGFGSDSCDRFKLTHLAVKRGLKLAHGQVLPQHIFVIGDTVHDMRAGKYCGAVTIAVGTGGHARKLKAEKPHYFLKDLRDAKPLVKILGLS